MKKATFVAIDTALRAFGYDNQTVLDELAVEINRGEARKEATAKEYEGVKDLILGTLGDAAATCGEIYEAIKDKLPDGFGKGKVQYALTHLWQDQIAIVDGNPKSYRRKW